MRPAYLDAKPPKVLHSEETEFNGLIEVLEVGSTRKLKVNGTTQSLSWKSPNARRLVWGQVAELIKEHKPNIKSALVMGLGGATAQHFIAQDFAPENLVSIEIDPSMYEIAKNYFEIGTIPNHRVVLDDACRVVIDPHNYDLDLASFEVLYIDIFVGQRFPDLGNSGNFMVAAMKLIEPGGLVIINRVYTKGHQDEVNNFIEFVEAFLRDVRTKVIAGHTNSDHVLIYGTK